MCRLSLSSSPSHSGQTTPIPDLYDFVNIFKSLPDERNSSLLIPTADSTRARDGRNTTNLSALMYRIMSPFSYIISAVVRCAEAKHTSSISEGRKSKGSQQPRLKGRGGNASRTSLTRPAPYGRLKAGRKAAIIAVVDNGTISFQKFGMTDFTELPWVGDGGTDSWERDVGPSLV